MLAAPNIIGRARSPRDPERAGNTLIPAISAKINERSPVIGTANPPGNALLSSRFDSFSISS
jgi:hypothetical protein